MDEEVKKEKETEEWEKEKMERERRDEERTRKNAKKRERAKKRKGKGKENEKGGKEDGRIQVGTVVQEEVRGGEKAGTGSQVNESNPDEIGVIIHDED